MKPTRRVVFILLSVSLMLVTSSAVVLLRAREAAASHELVECDGVMGKVKAVTSPDWHTTDIDFAQDIGQNPLAPGQFHPIPIVRALVRTERECIVAHFSTMAVPVDNSVVFQARLDGKPMQGHLSSWHGVQTPAVADPDFRDELLGVGIPGFDPALQTTPAGLPRMVAYNFFQRVEPGVHYIEIYFAGCCSGSGPHPGTHAASAGSPTLVVYYA